MNGAQALFKALTDAGVTTCFANPGTSEMQLVYEIGLAANVRPVLCLQEDVVTGAADGYARMKGSPAVTLLHVGSGFANGIAMLHNAGRANTPVINVVSPAKLPGTRIDQWPSDRSRACRITLDS
jgi:acetolactate synthase I/II/III large subunit